MIYLQIIWEAIKGNIIAVGIGIIGLLATISMFMPKDSKIYKLINFLSKKQGYENINSNSDILLGKHSSGINRIV